MLSSFAPLESDLHSVLQGKKKSAFNPQVLKLRNLPSLLQNHISRCSALRMDDDFTEWLSRSIYNFQLDGWLQTPSSEARKADRSEGS